MKTAIITGITGQDGAYLSKLLLGRGYKVVGLARSDTKEGMKGLEYLNILNQITIIECDLTDITQIIKILNQYKPTEIYNLAAQSSVSQSFANPIATFKFNTISVFNLLEAIKITDPKIKFYQASSSEMYGRVPELPIRENTVFHPLSPYAISKASAHWICVNYRESYNMFICCGILFNHESYLRTESFFVKKIITQAIKISKGEQEQLNVGNIDIMRDFGYAPKYVEAMYLMMQKETSNDYHICSGGSVSLRDLIEYTFNKLHIPRSKIHIDTNLFRPAEIENIYGANDKAKTELGWDYNLSAYDMMDLLIEEELTSIK